MALKFVRTINWAQRNLEIVLLADSQTVAVWDLIKTYTTWEGVLWAAAVPSLGVVHAIGQGDMALPPVNGVATAWSVNTSDLQSIATSTTGTYYAIVDTFNGSIYSAECSWTIWTTATSNLRGCRIDVDSANTDYGRVLESTATRTIGTPANFYGRGTDPNDSTRLLVSIALSELDSVYE